MSREPQQYRVELDVGVADRPQQRQSEREAVSPDVPFRIAILGDFSGRASRGIVEIGRALAARRPLRIDRDNVGDVLRRLSPQLRLPLSDVPNAVVEFSEMDDFHPDRLLERLPHFSRLRDAREVAAAAPASSGALAGKPAVSAQQATGTVLDQILADAAPMPSAAADATWSPAGRHLPADALAEFVDRAVTPHLLRDTAPARPELVARVEDAIRSDLRELLHQPHFKALESAWRAVDLLVRRLETDSMLQLFLIDVSREELAADLSPGTDLSQTGVHRLLVEASAGTLGEAPWAVLVGLFTFGVGAEDTALLRRIGALGSQAGAPFFAAAEPSVVGCPSFATAPDPDDWASDDAPAWRALQRIPEATHVGLALPRFLQRLPYGPDGEPCELAGFAELSGSPGSSNHEEHLWGNPAVLCALLIGEAFVAEGWALRPRLDIPGLPLSLIRDGGEVRAMPCAEALLSDRAVARIAERGLMAVRSMKGGDAVRLSRFQSLAEPLAPLASRWSAVTDVGR